MKIFYDPTIKNFARMFFSSHQPTYKKNPCKNVLLEYSKLDKLCRIRILYSPDFNPERIVFQHISQLIPLDNLHPFVAEADIFPMPPVREIAIPVTIAQYEALKALSNRQNKSVNVVILNGIQEYFVSKNTIFPNDFKMGIASISDAEFMKPLISDFVTIWYYSKSDVLFIRLNDKDISYIKLASDDVFVYYDTNDLVVGFRICNISVEEAIPFGLDIEYHSKRGKDIIVSSKIKENSPNNSKETLTLNTKLRLSPNQMYALERYSGETNISKLLTRIVQAVVNQ